MNNSLTAVRGRARVRDMPIEVERKLKAEARKKNVRDINAYVYGTMNKLGMLNKPSKPLKKKV